MSEVARASCLPGKREMGRRSPRLYFLFLVVVFSLVLTSGGAAAQPVMDLNLTRLVVLDDPNDNNANSADGFGTPPSNDAWNTTDYWNGEATTMRGYALIVNASGGVPGVDVSFNLTDPGGGTIDTATATTGASGLATYTFNLNSQSYYGYWALEATATVNSQTVTASETLIYNWWGCANCHGSENITINIGTFDQKSPYTEGWDMHANSINQNHSNEMQDGNCTVCHRGYDKGPSPGKNPNTPQYSNDTHNQVSNAQCVDCHVNADNPGNRTEIAGCYDTSGCHPQRNSYPTGINTTTGYSVGGNYDSVYSNASTGAAMKKAHTSTGTVPCVNCHGAGHDIWKPVTSGTSNTYTEDSQCTSCHDSRGKHSTSNPVYCTSCHSQDAHSIGALDTSATSSGSPAYTSMEGANAINDTASGCAECHSSGGVADFFASLTTYDSNAYSQDYNTTTDSYGYTVEKHNGTVDCVYCHDNTNYHKITFLNSSAQFTTDKSQAVGCEDCHVSGRSPAVRTYLDNNGLSAPAVGSEHNGSLACGVCHTPSPHGGARYLSSDLSTYTTSRSGAVICTDCHQGATGNTYDTRTGTYTMNQPTIGSYALQHGNATQEGQNWGSYWGQGDDNSACLYCHDSGDTVGAIHTSNARGNVTNVAGGAEDMTGQWCANCHVSTALNPDYSGSAYSPVPPLANSNNTGVNSNSAGRTWFNHTDLLQSNGHADSECYTCHANSSETPSDNLTLFVHNTEEGQVGPDCVKCHDTGGVAPAHVDVSALKQGVHASLNSGATNTTDLSDPVDKACWACHGDGSEPTSGSHPSNYKSPKVCEDCHTGSTQFSAPSVAEHYNNGQDLAANARCQDCHSKSEMLISNSDPDVGTTNATVSHYAKQRTDLRTWDGGSSDDCSYCHQNTSSAFTDIMADSTHNNMTNHSDEATNPGCTNANCHDTGLIHNSSLKKPTVSVSFCQSCHTGKETHNGTVSCTSCHTNNTRDIHGIKYIQSDGSYSTHTPGDSATCDTCHISPGVSGLNAPTFPRFNHSDDTIAGQKWNRSSTTYWEPGNATSACYFCHTSTLHTTQPYGKIDTKNITGTNTKNGTISESSYWCANCHYSQSQDNYNGTAFSPTVVNVSGWGINGTDGTTYEDHIDKGYISSSEHSDYQCDYCHGYDLQAGSTTKDFVHGVSEGINGGKDCISCHQIGGLALATNVAFNATHDSSAAHRDLNSGATTSLSSKNKKCWACHADGSEPPSGSHPDNYATPKLCQDCHINTSRPYGAPQVGNHHNGSSANVNVNAECYQCHSLSENQVSGSELDTEQPSGYTATDDNKSFASHYTSKRSDMESLAGEAYCGYCHQQQKSKTTSSAFNSYFSNSNNTKKADHSTRKFNGRYALCFRCHNGGNNNLHTSSLKLPTYDYLNDCKSCHVIISGTHVSGMKCTVCHANSSTGFQIHNVTYLQEDGTSFKPAGESKNKDSFVKCSTCHVSNNASTWLGSYGYTATKLPQLYHGDGASGSTTYWSDNYSACKYCHERQHNEGNPFGIMTRAAGLMSGDFPDEINATINSNTTTWCGSCHISGDTDYYWTVDIAINEQMGLPEPPLIPNDSNHSFSGDVNDVNCAGSSCHYSGDVTTDGMNQFMHNIQ